MQPTNENPEVPGAANAEPDRTAHGPARPLPRSPADEALLSLGDDAMLRPLKVSELLDISPRTLEKWRRSGRGPKWSQVGGRPVVFLGDLRAWLKAARQSGMDENGRD